MPRNALRIVSTDEPPIRDLQARMRAEIAQRDWSAVHVAADRRQPIALFDRIARTWR